MTQAQRQNLIVVATIVFFIGLGGYFTWHNAGGEGGGINSPSTTSKVLTAKKAREKSQALRSSRRKVDMPHKSEGGSAAEEALSGDESAEAFDEKEAGGQEEAGAQETAEERTQIAVREALGSMKPQTGIDRLMRHLENVKSMAEAADAYSALGTLYLQTDPPELDAAFGALSTATDNAGSPGSRHHNALIEAYALVEHGMSERALQRIESVLREEGPVTVDRLQLTLMLGRLHEDGDRLDFAEAAYQEVIDRAPTLAGARGENAWDVYRQACVKLSRIYNRTYRAKDAERLARAMQQAMGGE